MILVDRRSMLGLMLSGAAGATFAVVSAPAEAMPLPVDEQMAATAENFVEKTVVVVRRPVRRRVCWWRAGRRVCTWR